MAVVSGQWWLVFAYTFWGLSPWYWKFFEGIDPFAVFFHRVLWSFVFLTAVLLTNKTRRSDWLQIRNIKNSTVFASIVCGVLITSNWLMYVYCMVTHRVLQSSLGYFLTPLIVVLVGVIAFSERPSRLQWGAVFLALFSVILQFIFLQEPPLLAMGLALTFGFYGAIKKKFIISVINGLWIELSICSLFSLLCIFVFEYWNLSIYQWFLVVSTGPFTVIPLIWYVWGVQKSQLVDVGLLQFISPVLQFILALLFFREPFSTLQMYAFVLIWLALILAMRSMIRRSL